MLELASVRARRTFALTLWLAAVGPLWALWAFSWMSLGGVQEEIREMSRYYGVHLYKEHLRNQLVRIAETVERVEEEAAGDGDRRPLEHDLSRLAGLSGLEPNLLFIQQEEFQILYPVLPVRGLLSFVGEPGPREALFRTLRQMALQQAGEGYFSPGRDAAQLNPDSGKWVLVLEPAGERLLVVLLVPEDQLNRAGGTFEGALSALLEEKRRRYLLLALSFSIIVSALVWLLARVARPETDVASAKEGSC